ncbi:hypothetical protein D9V32_07175 [Mycetocola tolaasinivorans]|uniref:Uncharacterized protein n=1 Tax=Mycetocola tolaasinivorans TaxID=76635 RepID=A0A3L7A7T0_9MICO|nr:hypothetical protein D9V32_07175 [Mycetocola tolaasinivorans]
MTRKRVFWTAYALAACLISLSLRLLFPQLEPGYFAGGSVILVLLAPAVGRLFKIANVWSTGEHARSRDD